MSVTPSAVPPIFVINLTADTDRRHYMEEQLKKLPVQYELIKAVCADQLDEQNLRQVYAKDKAEVYTGRALQREEIACYLSHLKVMQKICDEDIPQAIVMEDDVSVSVDIVAFFEHQGQFPKGWPIIQLGNAGVDMPPLCHYRGARSVYKDYRIGRPFPLSYGTQGYVVRKEFCKYFLKNAVPIFVPIDHRLFDVFVSVDSFHTLMGKQLIVHKHRLFAGNIKHCHSQTAVAQKTTSRFGFRILKACSCAVMQLCKLMISISNSSSRYKNPTPIHYRNALTTLKLVCTNMLYSSFMRRFGLFGKFPRGI